VLSSPCATARPYRTVRVGVDWELPQTLCGLAGGPDASSPIYNRLDSKLYDRMPSRVTVVPKSQSTAPGRARETRGRKAPRKPRASTATGSVNKASARILRVLHAFAFAGDKSLGVSELSNSLGMTKNMVFRALTTLAQEGLVVRDLGGRYVIGYGIFGLCPPGLEIPDIRILCAPYMQRIHELVGETVMLSIAVESNSVVIDGIEGRGPLLSRVTHGRPIPLHAGPGSRALLSFRPDDEIAEYLRTQVPLAAVTSTTIVDPDALWQEIRLVRQRGYALGYRDNLSGVTGVAFPVFDADGRVQGAVSVGGPEDQFDDETLKAFVPSIKQIVDQLNQRSRLLHFDTPRISEF
jgi:IclR family KDG regulon transcriptional repressor